MSNYIFEPKPQIVISGIIRMTHCNNEQSVNLIVQSITLFKLTELCRRDWKHNHAFFHVVQESIKLWIGFPFLLSLVPHCVI